MGSAYNEEQIKDAIGKEDCNWKAVAAGFSNLYKDGKSTSADKLFEAAEANLMAIGNLDDLFRIYQAKARHVIKPAGVPSWSQKIQQVIGNEWENKTILEQSGFEAGLNEEEAFRRLLLLRSLKPGTVCWDKTWGTGVVGKIDHFYKRVDIDFKKKRGHQLALSYAAETLLLLDENHLFYWRHLKSTELDAKIKDHPGEIIKMAIRSFGPMSAIQLQEKLVPSIIEEKKWKSFWESARKDLRSDKSVQVPSSRTELIRVVEAADDDAGLGDLIGERNLDVLVRLFEEYADEIGSGGVNEAQKKILQDRLAFVVKGAWPRQLTVLARAKMAAVALGVDDESKPELAAIEKFLDPEIFQETLKKLSAKHSAAFLRYLSAHDKARLDAMVMEHLTSLDISSMSEVINYLIEQGDERKVAEVVRAAVDTRVPGIEILSWLSRCMEKVAAWNLGSMFTLLNFMIDEIEKDFSGDQLKAQNQLKDKFGKSDWMSSALSQLDGIQRETLTMRVKNSTGWTTLDKQSQLATIVKLYPELEAVIAGSVREQAASKPKGPLTSIRSYEARRDQLQRIINYEIPKVAKDIAHAREYGDLRENFEYKAAKDAQALLFRRRDELTEMLSKITPTDFKDLPYEKAGLATTVELTFGDGHTETYHLLGEWDSDPTLGIISSSSRLSQVLAGHKAGEHVMVPTEHGEATCTLSAVGPLPENIRRWVEGKV